MKMAFCKRIFVVIILILRIFDVWTFTAVQSRGSVVGFYENIFRTNNQQDNNQPKYSRLHAFSIDENESYSDEDIDELSDEELEATVGKWDEKIARFNTIQLTGRVGNTPEARYFDDGKVVVNLSLACRRKYHGMERKVNNMKMGEEETDWYGLEIWVR
jgi:regulatory protein YycI of two-component signal transduction system YycFG